MLEFLIERYVKDYRSIQDINTVESLAYRKMLKKVIRDLRKVEKNMVGLKRGATYIPTSTSTYFDSNTDLQSYNIDSGTANYNGAVVPTFESYWTNPNCLNENITNNYTAPVISQMKPTDYNMPPQIYTPENPPKDEIKERVQFGSQLVESIKNDAKVENITSYDSNAVLNALKPKQTLTFNNIPNETGIEVPKFSQEDMNKLMASLNANVDDIIVKERPTN